MLVVQQRRNEHDADPVLDVQQLRYRLPGQQRTTGRETDVHQAHQHQRDHRAIDTELHATGDHLRQAELRPLRGMQRHHPAAEQLPEQQADQRPVHIAAEHHRQRAGDDGRDLQVGTQPQGELTE